jgi:hypothetical protein
MIFGGDPMVRLRHTDQILLGHQLPLLPVGRLPRIYQALIGATATLAFYFLARDLMTESAAFLAAFLCLGLACFTRFEAWVPGLYWLARERFDAPTPSFRCADSFKDWHASGGRLLSGFSSIADWPRRDRLWRTRI